MAVPRMARYCKGGIPASPSLSQLADSNGGESADLLEGLTLELPIGAPPERGYSAAAQAHCIYPAQVRAFAKDLAQMLPKAVPGYVIPLVRRPF